MKSSRIFLLFAILSIVIVSSFADEDTVSFKEKDDIPLENKKKSTTPPSDKPERLRSKHRKQQQQQQQPHQDLDDIEDNEDYSPFLSGYAGNQYTASHGAEGNQRTQQPRWPQQKKPSQQQQQQMSFRFMEPGLNDWNNADEWDGVEFPNNPVPINLPLMPFNTPQVSDNGPTCHSLVDPQYPIFSDVCGAVPQARYSLPNAFGHSERWQIAQLLTNVVGSSTDSGCTRSLRLLLCPVLFPPCQARQDSSPVLPCQSYCRAVKSRCSIPALEALPCESLPFVSDICPTNQAYGSFLPPTSQPSLHQQTKSNADLQATNYQLSRTLASLQSLLASQGLQSQLNPSLLPQQQQQPINPSLLSQQTLQSPLNPSILSQQTSHTNQQKNLPTFAQQQQPTLNSRSPYSPETLSAVYAELSGHQSNGYPFAQNQRYPTPLTRSSNEARAQPEARFANLAFPRMVNPSAAIPTGIPSGIPSLVKA